jgi:trehalose/maltose transport system substrate-binding protein
MPHEVGPQANDEVSTEWGQAGVGGRLAVYALVALVCSCGAKPPSGPQAGVVLTSTALLENENLDAEREYIHAFTRETGIAVRIVPNRESVTERLEVYRRYFREESPVPDVLSVDVTWPSLFADNLMDLNSLLGEQAALQPAEVIRNNTVRGRLVAVPLFRDVGLLFYRSDLLASYGFAGPPRSWAELERMARSIQAGERRKGNAAFWGYVWQGAAYEGLTCNAMEWQGVEGGGRIIEEDGTISVNNPTAEAAWERASGWPGSISPPAVVEYKEADAENVFDAGNAAFMRNWIYSPSADARSHDRMGVATLPRGGVIGDGELGISRYSKHPLEAAIFIRFFTARSMQLTRAKLSPSFPTMPSLQADLVRLDAARLPVLVQATPQGSFARPSAVAGRDYDRVSRAYFLAVHSVLKHERTAAEALESLEKELSQIPGLRLRVRPAGHVAEPHQ